MSSTNTHSEGLAVEVRDLRKSYGEVEAVRGVSLEVAAGEVFCLLGPNGAALPRQAPAGRRAGRARRADG
jgi:ABC-2 type transport system ATP-binding protein